MKSMSVTVKVSKNRSGFYSHSLMYSFEDKRLVDPKFKELVHELNNRVKAFAEPFGKHPYIVSVFSKAKYRTNYDIESVDSHTRRLKYLVKLVRLIGHNVDDPGVKKEASDLLDETMSYLTFLKLTKE